MTTFAELHELYRVVGASYQVVFSFADGIDPSVNNRILLKKHSRTVRDMYNSAALVESGQLDPLTPEEVAPLVDSCIDTLSACATTQEQPYWNALLAYGVVIGYSPTGQDPDPDSWNVAFAEYMAEKQAPVAQWLISTGAPGQNPSVTDLRNGNQWSNRRPFDFLYGTPHSGGGRKQPGVMLPGDLAMVSDGTYMGTHRFANKARKGQPMVEFRAEHPGKVFLIKTDVGGSDGTYDEAAHSKIMRGFTFYKATRASLKSESNKKNVATDIWYLHCAMHKDWDTTNDTGRTGGKWLGHFYYTGRSERGEDYGFMWVGHIPGVINGRNHDEQAFYFHGILQPGVLIKDFGFWQGLGRSFVKATNRPGENGAYYGSAGLLHIENGMVADACLEQGGGGSYIDLSGHTGQLLVRNVEFRIGEDASLDPDLGKNITGMLVSDAYSGIAGGDIKLDGVTCKRGGAYRAGRSNVFLKEVAGKVTLVDCQMLDAPGQPPNLDFHTSMVKGPIITSVNRERNLWTGTQVINGQKFKDPDGDGSGFVNAMRWLETNHPAKVVLV